MKKRNLGPFWMFMAALTWSTVGLFTKNIPWNGFSIGITRGAVAFVLMMLIYRRFPKKITKIKLVTAGCYFMQGLLFVAANRYTTAANATILQNTSPIYIILITSLLTRKLPSRRDVITCLFMMSGISLVCIGSMGRGGALGNILALSSALFYAGVYFCSALPGADSTESIIIGNGFYMVFFPLIFLGNDVKSSGSAAWLYALALGTAVMIGWICFAKGIATTKPLQANFITMLEPVMSPAWTFIFLHETISSVSLIGCAMVIVTLLVYHATASGHKVEMNEPN